MARIEKQRQTKTIWIGAALSVVLLFFFWYLQIEDRDLLELPVQYLIVAFIPLLIGLILSGYVRKLSVGSLGAEVGGVDEILDESRPIPDQGTVDKSSSQFSGSDWQAQRTKEYERTRGYMLAHVYKPSKERGQTFDISIFIVRHQKGTTTPPLRNLDEISKAEFFFGESWGNRVFEVSDENGFFGVRVHAWGTFLATCKVTFKDAKQTPILLNRYIDFSMAQADT